MTLPQESSYYWIFDFGSPKDAIFLFQLLLVVLFGVSFWPPLWPLGLPGGLPPLSSVLARFRSEESLGLYTHCFLGFFSATSSRSLRSFEVLT